MAFLRIFISYLHFLRYRSEYFSFSILNFKKEKYECPICGYIGPFQDINPHSGLRKNAKCPKCHALERHRLQFLVLRNIFTNKDTSSLKIIHFAPEVCFREVFLERFGKYETADLEMKDVEHRVDLQCLPFPDNTYDFVFASHVLEHVLDDNKALFEIHGILKPKGAAILPVPIIAEKTVEYPEPNPVEYGHVRAPGPDYLDKYERYFSRVERFGSDSFPNKYQLYIYEDRSKWPTAECPFRPPMYGEKHIEIVTICYK